MQYARLIRYPIIIMMTNMTSNRKITICHHNILHTLILHLRYHVTDRRQNVKTRLANLALFY